MSENYKLQKKTAPILNGIALFFIVFFIAINSSYAQESTDEKLSNVKEAINKQKSTIKRVDNKRQKLLALLKKDELEISSLIKSINKTSKALVDTKNNLSNLIKEQKQLAKEKKIQESVLADQLRAAYSTGHHDYLKLILNQKDPGRVQRTVTYYQYLNQARIKEIETYQTTITRLTEVVILQKEQAETLTALEQKQSNQKIALEKNKKKRQTTVAQLHKQLLNSKQKLNQLEEEEANLVAALARMSQLSKQEINLTGLSKLKRKLSWPVKGRINRSFGSRKQDYLKWKGVLMSAPLGRQVKTIHNGTVLFSDWLKGYGLVTVIDHGEGYMSLYGHNQALLKSVGDRVETGEPIALIGQSGGQSQPGLYFEIRHKGQAVNPKLWCK